MRSTLTFRRRSPERTILAMVVGLITAVVTLTALVWALWSLGSWFVSLY